MIDLYGHSNCSDGALNPEKLPAICEKKGKSNIHF